jgi:hypothetical protein
VQVTGCFKTQIDWLPLNTGSVRPTQGRTVMVAQVMSPCYQSDRMDECGCACGSLIEFRLIEFRLNSIKLSQAFIEFRLIEFRLIEFRLNSIKLPQALIKFRLIEFRLIEFRLNSIKLPQALIEFSPQEVEFDLGALVTFD